MSNTDDIEAATRTAGNRRTGLLLAVAASAGVGVNAITAKYAEEALHPLTFVPLWFTVAWVCSSVTLLVKRVPIREPLRRSWKGLLSVGVLHALAATMGFWGLHLLDPTVASFFTRSSVLVIWLLGLIVMRERPTALAIVGTVISMAGVAVLSYATGTTEPLGVALCLGSAVCMALGVMAGKQVADASRTVLTVWVRAGTIAVLVGGLSLATGHFHIVPSWSHLAVLAGGAVVGPFASQLLFFYSLKHVALSEAGIIRATTPLFVAVYSFVFLGMFPTGQQLLGGAAIIAGVLLLARAKPVEPATPVG